MRLPTYYTKTYSVGDYRRSPLDPEASLHLAASHPYVVAVPKVRQIMEQIVGFFTGRGGG